MSGPGDSTGAGMRRIAVIGSSCSGKTTLARRLAGVLDVPHVELDAIHWEPNWSPRPLEDFRTLTRAAVEPDCWVMDGNYSSVRDIVWGRATALVWLNYDFPTVFSRALVRTIRRVVTRETLYSDNRETFKKAFLSRDSILWWVITTFRDRRRRYRSAFDGGDCAHLKLVELRRPREAEALVRRLKRPAQ